MEILKNAGSHKILAIMCGLDGGTPLQLIETAGRTAYQSRAKITDDSIIPGDDGVRADFTDGMIIFRYSQNGPYITIKFEAKDQDTYDKRKKYVREMLKSYSEMIWEDELCVNLDSLN